MCQKLKTNTIIEQTYDSGSYCVSLPTRHAELEQQTSDDAPSVQLSPNLPALDITFRLSATDLAASLGVYREIQLDAETQAAFVEKKDPSPDDRRGEEDLTERAATDEGHGESPLSPGKND